MVKSVVNGVTTYYPGRHYNKEVNGTTERTQKFYQAAGQTIAVRTNGDLKWILSDHLGSTSVTANANGTWNSELRYTPYGETRYNSGLTPSDYRYTGQLQQAELGLYYYVARWYDPYLNQFIQPDTIVPDPYSPQDWNRYTYVRNSPINFVDPSGKMPAEPPDRTCLNSAKLIGVAQGLKESVCGMITELEEKGYLIQTADENHISAGKRSPEEAHRWSTAFHILHDIVSVEDLRKTSKDLDNNVWYKQEWDVLFCLSQDLRLDPAKRLQWMGYLDYLVKKNASDQAEDIQMGGRLSGYIFTPFGLVRDVNYAAEGYEVGDPNRLPNSSYPQVSKHVYGLAVDISMGILQDEAWKQLGYTEIDKIADAHGLQRPLNTPDYVNYTNAEFAEWWHFEPY